MKKTLFIVALFLSVNLFSQKVDMVNPFVGTDDHGHTYPGAVAPFGMVQLSPDTRIDGWDGCSGYHYTDSVIYGFSHTHLSGTGCLDYGDILFIPTVNAWNAKDYSLHFSHKDESAVAGYYKVKGYNEDSILVELTATERGGYHRYTFPTNNKTMTIIIDMKHRTTLLDYDIQIFDKNTVVGYRRSKAWNEDKKIYFAARFNSNIVKSFLDENTKKLYLSFGESNQDNNIVEAKVCLSSVDMVGALKNLNNETCKDFNQARELSRNLWEKALSKIEVEGGTKEEQMVFYTALYHTMITPNLYSDVDGRYRGMGKDEFNNNNVKIEKDRICTAKDYNRYTVFSLWDTYRTLNPLLSIIDRKHSLDFAKTFLDVYKQNGELPMWELASYETYCMIGIHGISVLADWYMKGIKGDEGLTMEAMINNANSKRKMDNLSNNYNRTDYHLYGLDYFDNQGYISSENEHEGVSKTVEYCYNMYCVAQIAKKQGKMDIYNEYIKKAQYYKNLFNPQNTFIQPKENGRFLKNFDPKQIDINYTEGNGWQYTFYVPQDMNTLMDMMGGENEFCKKLDQCFNSKEKTTGREQADVTGLIGQYAHGNEPSQHMAYLYCYGGQAYKTQKLVRQILTTLYKDNPKGICGNDDCGQMSAWFVMSSLGFYPVCPVSNEYVVGSPLFDKVTINLENGKKFIINSKQGKNTPYVQSLSLNGKKYDKTFITYDDIKDGGELTFTMSDKPNKDFGKKQENRPNMKITDNIIEPVPYLDYEGTGTFTGKLNMTVHSLDKQATITMNKYDLNIFDGRPVTRLLKDGDKINIDTTSSVGFFANNDDNVSKLFYAKFYKIPEGRTIKILSKYSPQYTAGGDEALIDQRRGSDNWRLGSWQGYWGENVEAVVDLGKKQEVKQISGEFIQDERAWIFMPTKVEYYTSDNGKDFSLYQVVYNPVDERNENIVTHLFSTTTPTTTRYIKMIAYNRMTNPSWHLSPGEKSWLFIDEILIK